jgi:hypothetical protein
MNEQVPSDPKTIAADIARELREHPEHWRQGLWKEGMAAGAKCLGAHIEVRAGGPSMAMKLAFGFNASNFELIDWNDAPGRTVDDVIELCEKVANG